MIDKTLSNLSEFCNSFFTHPHYIKHPENKNLTLHHEYRKFDDSLGLEGNGRIYQIDSNGKLDTLAKTLHMRNKQHLASYYIWQSIDPTTEKPRNSSAESYLTYFILDFDNTALESPLREFLAHINAQSITEALNTFNLTPTLIYETSPKHYHYLIPISPINIQKAPELYNAALHINKQIAKLFGADTASVSKYRKLRIPGSINAKKQLQEEWIVKIKQSKPVTKDIVCNVKDYISNHLPRVEETLLQLNRTLTQLNRTLTADLENELTLEEAELLIKSKKTKFIKSGGRNNLAFKWASTLSTRFANSISDVSLPTPSDVAEQQKYFESVILKAFDLSDGQFTTNEITTTFKQGFEKHITADILVKIEEQQRSNSLFEMVPSIVNPDQKFDLEVHTNQITEFASNLRENTSNTPPLYKFLVNYICLLYSRKAENKIEEVSKIVNQIHRFFIRCGITHEQRLIKKISAKALWEDSYYNHMPIDASTVKGFISYFLEDISDSLLSNKRLREKLKKEPLCQDIIKKINYSVYGEKKKSSTPAWLDEDDDLADEEVEDTKKEIQQAKEYKKKLKEFLTGNSSRMKKQIENVYCQIYQDALAGTVAKHCTDTNIYFQNGLIRFDSNTTIGKFIRDTPKVIYRTAANFDEELFQLMQHPTKGIKNDGDIYRFLTENNLCPQYTKYIEAIAPYKEDPNAWGYILKIHGYCMMPSNPFQKAFNFFGEARAGKGTMFKLIAHTIGHSLVNYSQAKSISLKAVLASGGYESAENKLIWVFDDVQTSSTEDQNINSQAIGNLMSLIGGTPITIRKLYTKAYTAYLDAKIIMTSNDVIEYQTTSQAALDARTARWEPFYFGRTIKEESREMNLAETILKTEGPQLATLAAGYFAMNWPQQYSIFNVDCVARKAAKQQQEVREMPSVAFINNSLISTARYKLAEPLYWLIFVFYCKDRNEEKFFDDTKRRLFRKQLNAYLNTHGGIKVITDSGRMRIGEEEVMVNTIKHFALDFEKLEQIGVIWSDFVKFLHSDNAEEYIVGTTTDFNRDKAILKGLRKMSPLTEEE